MPGDDYDFAGNRGEFSHGQWKLAPVQRQAPALCELRATLLLRQLPNSAKQERNQLTHTKPFAKKEKPEAEDERDIKQPHLVNSRRGVQQMLVKHQHSQRQKHDDEKLQSSFLLSTRAQQTCKISSANCQNELRGFGDCVVPISGDEKFGLSKSQ